MSKLLAISLVSLATLGLGFGLSSSPPSAAVEDVAAEPTTDHDDVGAEATALTGTTCQCSTYSFTLNPCVPSSCVKVCLKVTGGGGFCR